MLRVIRVGTSFSIEPEERAPPELTGAVASPTDREQMRTGAGVEYANLLGLRIRDPQRSIPMQSSGADSTEEIRAFFLGTEDAPGGLNEFPARPQLIRVPDDLDPRTVRAARTDCLAPVGNAACCRERDDGNVRSPKDTMYTGHDIL